VDVRSIVILGDVKDRPNEGSFIYDVDKVHESFDELDLVPNEILSCVEQLLAFKTFTKDKREKNAQAQAHHQVL